MANFRTSPTGNNDWPATSDSKVVDKDPMMVRVPLDEVEWGARKSQMARAKGQDGFSENRMQIKHVDDANKGAA